MLPALKKESAGTREDYLSPKRRSRMCSAMALMNGGGTLFPTPTHLSR